MYLGTGSNDLNPVELERTLAFPLQVTVRVETPGDKVFTAEAHNAAGTVLARGSAIGRARRQGAPSTTIELLAMCEGGFADGTLCFLESPDRAVCSSGTCVVAKCGDGYADDALGEKCDDGTNDGGEGECAPGCVGPQTCGDGVTHGTEACDDGQSNSNDWAFFPHCALDCSGPGPHCGDETRNGFEDCDDGNDGDDCNGCLDGCRQSCVCDPNDCEFGERCVLGVCVPCADETHCGQDCAPCAGNTPICAGPAGGCVADETAGGCVGLPDYTPCQVTTEPDRAFDVCVGGVCISPGTATYSDGIDRTPYCMGGPDEWHCNVPFPGFSLADTGIRDCYRNAEAPICAGTAGDPTCGATDRCGQDAQYGWDVTHDGSERFSLPDPPTEEPVVSDTVTGLMWQGCPARQRGADCTAGDVVYKTWADALAYCDGLRWAGFSDWRLPDKWELQSIADYSLSSPAIDLAAFPETLPARFWASPTFSDAMSNAWYVDFSRGRVHAAAGKSTLLHARCVRVPPRPLAGSRYSVSEVVTDQPVVLDNATSLAWQGCEKAKTGSTCAAGSWAPTTWALALSYCEDLDWGGHTDWRLPNLKELMTIVADYGAANAIDPQAFPGSVGGGHWSSTFAFAELGPAAYDVHFDFGLIHAPHFDGSSYSVRCLRTAD